MESLTQCGRMRSFIVPAVGGWIDDTCQSLFAQFVIKFQAI
jgi:hypothetical protein